MTQELGSSLAGYGNVVELRINSGGKLPNFGFVVFDDPDPVQKILSNRVNKLSVGLVATLITGSVRSFLTQFSTKGVERETILVFRLKRVPFNKGKVPA